MASQLVSKGKTASGLEYRIFNIDNIYTVYIQIETKINLESDILSKSVYSAIKSFPNLKDANEYAKKL